MTQPTIKEKINDLIGSYPWPLVQKIGNQKGRVCYPPDGFIRDFARLICEEMTGIEGHGEQDTYDDRVFEEKQKAKEILKALE